MNTWEKLETSLEVAKAVVLNLWVTTPLGNHISDIYIMTYYSSKIATMKEQQNNFMAWGSAQHEELC